MASVAQVDAEGTRFLRLTGTGCCAHLMTRVCHCFRSIAVSLITSMWQMLNNDLVRNLHPMQTSEWRGNEYGPRTENAPIGCQPPPR
jgi:hypothetical protein